MSGIESPRQKANRDQLAASDPAVSAFVAASAGSGKTKLLTDRLLRLMLAGAAPERILCLTFTKAAAAEMAVRLQRTLGRWVTLNQEALAGELRRLAVEPTESACLCARALFARVLDLPGGMRILTIHAFCQSLLRRFPLEAALSPHFRLIDERDAEEAQIEAREDMLSQAHAPAMKAALGTLAGLVSVADFGKLVGLLLSDRVRLDAMLALGPRLPALQLQAVGAVARSRTEIMEASVNWQGEPKLREAARVVREGASEKVREKAAAMLDWLARPDTERVAGWAEWRAAFIGGGGKPFAPKTFVNDALARRHPDLQSVFLAEAQRIQAVDNTVHALEVAELSAALFTLAEPVLRAYANRKDQGGLLDYDDLIGRSAALLRDPGAAWVLYKLDGGLDHVLLDESQDTAPAQWRIAHALTEEFFAGDGARDHQRTVFAVGDRKQSIYSFQGADTDEFDRARATLRARVKASGQEFHETGLDVSFRSTAPVLALVDAVFADPRAAAGVVAPGDTLTHLADRADHAGRVELWPLAPPVEVPPPEPWIVPERNQGLVSAPQRLAERLAVYISEQTSGGVLLESRNRPLRPGDVLVLVRRRNAFARALVRALKARGVPVAGLDRLMLTEQPAVQDLVALCDALLLPQDDLAFACLLTSPLGGLDDTDLMALAIGRGSAPLWTVLRARAPERPHWARAWAFFEALLGRVDYASPYALLSEALGPLGGRARLFGRLGAEAAEPIDELLNAALAYGRSHPPSLQGFLHWLRRAAAEVKREADAGGDMVRIMTAHGAKGLQAPLVILPDTTALPPEDRGILRARVGEAEVPLWVPRKDFRCSATEVLRDTVRQRQMEEHNRLLYVALTRAEDRLVVCGWQGKKAVSDDCWYRLVERGFAVLTTGAEPFQAWPGERLFHESPQNIAVAAPASVDRLASGPPLPRWLAGAPSWISAQPPVEPPRPSPLAPSKPEGVELGAVPEAASPLTERPAPGERFQRGLRLHELLQHLPAIAAGDRAGVADRYLRRPGFAMDDAECAASVTEVLAILDHPDLAPLFGPGSKAEVPLTGVVGDRVIGGLVDRLAVLPDRVLVADFKTNRHPSEHVEQTPVLYLRQMASYRAVLKMLFPDRPVICALVWTRVAHVMMLPDALLDRHAPDAA